MTIIRTRLFNRFKKISNSESQSRVIMEGKIGKLFRMSKSFCNYLWHHAHVVQVHTTEAAHAPLTHSSSKNPNFQKDRIFAADFNPAVQLIAIQKCFCHI